MEKLEIKHLAPYLPYELKMVNYEKRYCFQLLSLSISNDIDIISADETWNYENHRCHNLYYNDKLQFYPILRPISDLSKEIEHNGEKFIPKEIFIRDNESLTSYDGVTTLCEWHFDIFGLIKKGLAVDINTLTK